MQRARATARQQNSDGGRTTMARSRDGFTDMDWDKLKVFHAAAEAGSFTHAGEQLGLSQSAVSRQVSALEQELSVSLFHRHARGLILTEQGDLLFRTAHDVFMQLQARSPRTMPGKRCSDAHVRPLDALIASRRRSGSSPAATPATMASAVAARLIPFRKLLIAFAVWPAPVGPRWSTVRARCARPSSRPQLRTWSGIRVGRRTGCCAFKAEDPGRASRAGRAYRRPASALNVRLAISPVPGRRDPAVLHLRHEAQPCTCHDGSAGGGVAVVATGVCASTVALRASSPAMPMTRCHMLAPHAQA